MLGIHARRRASSQGGFALIEVVASAALLLIVVLGVLAGMDATSRTAGANQARTVAGTLAEQDLERLRALRTTDLDRLAEIQLEPRTVDVDGVPYTIESEAKWVLDSGGGELSCATAEGEGSYMRVTSRVTSPATGAAVPPIVLSSIVAPQPGKGTLSAMVRNAAGGPVTGLMVTVSGPKPGSEPTSDAGCAVLDERDAGSYVVVANHSAFVDPAGETATQKSATVTAGTLTTVELVYDRAAAFAVNVRTGAGQPDLSTGAIAAHTGMPTGLRLATSTTAASTLSFTRMFPFTTPYQVYSGTCPANDPSKYVTGYFAAHPEAVVQLAPGTVGPTAEVIEPAIDALVTNNGTAAANARVYLYPKGEGCTVANAIDLGATGATGRLTTVTGHPYGVYDLCAHWRASSSSTRRKVIVRDLTSNDPAGKTVAFPITSSSTSGSCDTDGTA